MTEVDPRDPDVVAQVLVDVAGQRFGGEVATAGAPTRVGAGFDSYIHLVQLAGPTLPPPWSAPLVVRLLPEADRLPQARREAAVQGWCAERDYPAPAVLAVLAPEEGFGLPAQVMARAPGVTALDACTSRPWRALAVVDLLAELQLRLHALDPAGMPGVGSPTALADQRLALPRRVVERTGSPELAAALEDVEQILPLALADPAPVPCHGDFHPLNVMVDGRHGEVIDWTDAGVGPREADVARTLMIFHVAAIAADSALQRLLLARVGPLLARRYRRTYTRSATLDPTRLRAWEALHAVHGWSQVLMLHAGGFDDSSSAEATDVPLHLAPYLEGRMREALAALA